MKPETCLACGLGYNPHDQYLFRSAWGMEDEQGTNGHIRTKLKIPQGIVIATMRKKEIVALTIRTHDPKRKYWQVKGSANVPYLVGKIRTPIVLLEGALDAVLLYQETQAAVVAFMGSTKPSDASTQRFVAQASLVLACSDNDNAGHSAWHRWHWLFPTAKLWPPLGGKDIGEMHKMALENGDVPTLKNWLYAAQFCAGNAP